MRKRLLNGVNMKIAAATSVVIFTLLVSFIGVYAWFEASRNVDNTADTFKVEKLTGAVQSFSIYQFDGYYTYVDGNEEKHTVWGFNPTPKYKSEGDIGDPYLFMGTYSLDYPMHPALVVFEVEGSYETIKGKLKNASTQYMTSEYPTLDADEDYRYDLSSVIETYYFLSESNPVTTMIDRAEDHPLTYYDEEEEEEKTKTTGNYVSFEVSDLSKQQKDFFRGFDNNNDPLFEPEAVFLKVI